MFHDNLESATSANINSPMGATSLHTQPLSPHPEGEETACHELTIGKYPDGEVHHFIYYFF